MDAETETAAPPSAAARLQLLDSPMRPQVIKFCYRKRPTGHSRNGNDDSSQDPKNHSPSSPLSRQSLSTSAIPTYHAGWFYEIDHERLPPRTPIHLKSIRVVKVSEYTSLDITVSFPSLQALRSFFSSFPAPSAGSELDELFVMSSNHAARIMRRRVVEQELEGEMHQDSFWLVNPCLYDFSASSHLATLPDALSSPEAPPAQPKAPVPSSCLLDTLKCDGAGWGVRRRVRYIGRHRDASKEASIGGYETEASVRELQSPAQQEDKRSSVSGKRKRGEAEGSNDKPSNEMRTKKKTYKNPKKQKKRHVESKDGDPRRGKDRWSAERYPAAERSLLEIMRSSGASLGAPVMRQALREQARKRIGDTGLLDHLLKHMAGRVPDGSTERFRRRHNADGAMEYWLEPADLAEMRQEASVSDPYWVLPPGWKPGDDVSPAAGDLLIKRQVEELAEELNDVKRHMEQLSSNMVQLDKEAKSEAERASSSWKEKYQKVVKANEKLDKHVLSLKDTYENVVQKNSKLKQVRSLKDKYEFVVEKNDKLEEQMASLSSSFLSLKEQFLLARNGGKLKMGIDQVAVAHNNGKLAIGIGGGDQSSKRADVTVVQAGDTGLRDHLLKSMAGRVPDGCTERFHQRHNADGAMEYWLEPADLAEMRREAGVSDPYWVLPPGWKPDDDVSPAAGDLLIKRQVEELAEELNDVKRHMEQLSSNMVQLGMEPKSEAERAYSSWKEKYQKVVKANEMIEIQPPSSPLSGESLSTFAVPIYHGGWFYEIDHERLAPRTPIHLKSIRVVKVIEYTSLDITVSFPSLQALRSFFSSFPAPSAGPELDERFVMSSNHAARILRRWVAEQELEGEMHQDSFWLVNPCLYDFSASSHPATLPDVLSSPEAPPAQPNTPAPSSCLLDTLKCDGTGWGVRRRDASKEASIGGYKTEAIVKEQQRLAQQEDKRSSVSGKRKRGEAARNRTARMLLVLTTIWAMFSVAHGTCDSSHLAEDLVRYCNSSARTMECCEPIVSAIDFGGGIDCLCQISHNPLVTDKGQSFTSLLDSYIDCGGLHPEAYHHASKGYCAGYQPPSSFSPPPPDENPSQSPPPPTSSAPPHYWDGWNDHVDSWHNALELPSNKTIIEGVGVTILVLIGKRFQNCLLSFARRFARWFARWMLGLLVQALHRFGLVPDPEQVMGRMELEF